MKCIYTYIFIDKIRPESGHKYCCAMSAEFSSLPLMYSVNSLQQDILYIMSEQSQQKNWGLTFW